MFSYIFSFFRTPEPELSLEDSSKILTQDVESLQLFFNENSKEINLRDDLQLKEEYNLITQTGEITGKFENSYVIDNIYEFDSDCYEFEIGTPVTYQKYISEGKFVIYNVNPIASDWDTVVQSKESILSNRIMICKVEKRDKRTLFLTPGQTKVDLNKVSIEFVPIVGDWLELDVKYEVNEDCIDLSGEIIEINKITPLRPHIKSGQVSVWDSNSRIGCISKNIYFNQDSLSCGYIPIVGDKVVAEIIESEQQNNCIWRALKVLPENISKKFDSSEFQNSNKVEETHPGLDIGDININFSKLGETRDFIVTLSNKSNETFKILSIELPELTQSQVLLKDTFSSQEILPGKYLNLNFSCNPKNMGSSNEFLLFYFEGFTVGKYVNINVSPNSAGGYYQRNNMCNYRNAFQGDKQLIRGQRGSSTRFQAVRLPDYPVPKKLLELVVKYDGGKDKLNLIEELKIVKRSLFNNLSAMNYEEKFHTLLHLDEIANLMCIRQYDQDRTCFIKNGEFLMLEIENLAERRPSIVLGDRILASDPLENCKNEYEGNVYRCGGKHVYLKFSSIFHETYNGEDYSVRVVPGRSAYKRQHHAVFLVARHLGKEWLFPTKIIEKFPQIAFIFDPYPKVINLHSNQTTPRSDKTPNGIKKRSSPRELIKKAKEVKLKMEIEKFMNKTLDESETESVVSETSSVKSEASSKSEENLENNNVRKLEWYNQRLNCKQKDAVINILKGVSRPLPYIIFGPPGTGKTVTVIETILQIVRMIPESRILVTAPSNSAADLIAVRLIASGVLKPGDLVRLVSVNYAVGDNIPPKLVPYCATGSVAKEGTADDNNFAQNGMLLDCSRSVLGRHKITVSTCSSAGTLHMMGFPKGHFTHIFVDEAGQAAEPEVMIPVSFLDKYVGQVVLAGDPMQLGPVALSQIAAECGLSESLLERFINRFPYVRDIQGFPESEGFDPRLVTKLLYNYRSLSPILKLFSDLFYNGELIPTIPETGSPESDLLSSLSSILPKTKDGAVPSMVFHGVDGENYQTADSPSWYNPHEAAQVFYYVNEFYRLGLKPFNIGVITPYTKQFHEIRNLLREAEFALPKIGTVEDFQGQEFDVILLSTVRSSRDFIPSDIEHSLGFVSSPRRLNVAISRPKSLLVIVGNPGLLCYDTYWRTVIQYCVGSGGYTGCSFGGG